MKKSILFILSLVLVTLSTKAQNYDQSLGLRLGLTNGISYKASFDGVSGLELIGSYKSRYTALTGLYELHFYSFRSDNLYLVAGIGGHIGAFKPVMSDPTWILGADGIIGVEYCLDRTPIALTLDVIPSLDFIGRVSQRKTISFGWFGVTARYTFE
ncbi:MAG: hypothetical protein AB8F95_01135 [Bacteroidia bacterium]